jgi:RecA-family ATPase
MWSMRDFDRYKAGECERKWNGFRGSAKPVTAGTLVELAKQQGAVFAGTKYDEPGRELDWNDEIGPRDWKIIRQEWLQDAEMSEPTDEKWNPAADLRKYLSSLFQAEEHVGYVVDAWKNEDGKWLPKKGNYDRTAGQLISMLTGKTVQAAINDYSDEAGAWIRFNPLDGKGVRDENVTDYRHALVESDSVPCERQLAIYRELEIPCAAIVHSGGKSVHAIVKVEAKNLDEYRQRVDFLYDTMKKNGLGIDRQNRNPSRLSRMPGVTRNGKKQYLVDTNAGKASWQEWRDWIEQRNDDLPEVESLESVWDNIPPLADPLIHDILRTGHKMLIAGPSKAGKSFLLLNLAISIAEGRDWIGWQCNQGRVLYVNLELDRASCLHRLKNMYSALGIPPKHIRSIDLWNLRGRAVPMDKLAPRLIWRAVKKKYDAVIIDPIYKVITGDENAADQMAKFCNQFDKVCHELGAAVIYCHHHSKGSQGQKNAHDRSSGSGVFARDPDALLDLIELEIDENRRKQIVNRELCEAIRAFAKANGIDHDTPPDDALVADKFMDDIRKIAPDPVALSNAVFDARQQAERMTGWRIEGILREFPGFDPKRIWFKYPAHSVDDTGLLLDARAEGELPAKRTRGEAIAEKRQSLIDEIEEAFDSLESFKGGEPVTISDIAEHVGITEEGVRKRIRASQKQSGIRFKKGVVFMESQE